MTLKDTIGPLTLDQCTRLLVIAASLIPEQSVALIGAGHSAAYFAAAGLRAGHPMMFPPEVDNAAGCACFVLDDWAKRPPDDKKSFSAVGRELGLVPPIISMDGDPAEQILNFREAPAIGLLVVDVACYNRVKFEEATNNWMFAVPPGGRMLTIDFAFDPSEMPGWEPEGETLGDGLIAYTKVGNTYTELRALRHNEWYRQEARKPRPGEQLL